MHYIECVEGYEWLYARSNRALKTWAKKDFEHAKLARVGQKYIRVWEHQKRVLRDMHERGKMAIEHCTAVESSFAFLCKRGEVAVAYQSRHNDALEFLQYWGYTSSHHVAGSRMPLR